MVAEIFSHDVVRTPCHVNQDRCRLQVASLDEGVMFDFTVLEPAAPVQRQMLIVIGEPIPKDPSEVRGVGIAIGTGYCLGDSAGPVDVIENIVFYGD